MQIVIELGPEVSEQAEQQVIQIAQACQDRQVDFNGDEIKVRRGEFTCIIEGEKHDNAASLHALVQHTIDENKPFFVDDEGRTIVPLASGAVCAMRN